MLNSIQYRNDALLEGKPAMTGRAFARHAETALD
jgi:hypothetical protein